MLLWCSKRRLMTFMARLQPDASPNFTTIVETYNRNRTSLLGRYKNAFFGLDIINRNEKIIITVSNMGDFTVTMLERNFTAI